MIHVRKAVENFDLNQINPIKVSRRNGINYVFNGQHTAEIIAMASGSRDTPVWCMIYDDLEYTEEADIFANQMKNVKALQPIEIFKANRKHEVTEKTRGPFEQARSGMFVVEKIIKKILGSTFERTRILYGYGVIFTDEYNFPVNSITEDEPWRLIQNNVPKDYTEFIKRLEKNFRKELQSLNKGQPRSISKEEAEAISKALRPEIGLVPPLKSFIENSEDDVIALTQKQYECLIDVEMNNHVVVQGGAGTGKTVLALEDARRTAEQNKRVLFLCFNVNLAKELKQRINNDLIELHSFHSYLMKICKDNLDGTDTNNDDFFSTVLPSIACNVLDNSDAVSFI